MSMDTQWVMDLEHDLTDHGLDFLRRAITAAVADNPDQREMTHVAINLAIGIEVLLKSRLLREHWTLISKHPGKATLKGTQSGNQETVGSSEAIERLLKIAAIDIPKKHTESVTAINRLRNRAVHFAPESIPIQQTKAYVGRGLSFAHWLLTKHFGNSTTEQSRALACQFLADTSDDLRRFEAFVTARMNELRAALDRADLRVECPHCHLDAFVVQGPVDVTNAPRCLFCGDVYRDPELFADEYVEEVLNLSSYEVVKDGGEWPVLDCPACDVTSFVEAITQTYPAPAEEVRIGACFSCGESAIEGVNYTRCYRCSRPSREDLCLNCMHDFAASGTSDW